MTTDRIEINPEILSGKPVIRGTRIPVELIIRKLSEGATEADLLDAYPRLTRADIQAALDYADNLLAQDERWRIQFESLLTRVHAGMSAFDPDEIETDITAAAEEVKAERH